MSKKPYFVDMADREEDERLPEDSAGTPGAERREEGDK